MPFASSDPAALQIREAAGRGTLSHALLFTGGGDLTGAARYAAAAMECLSGRDKPCGVCPACRKVLSGIHPDVITVRDEAHRSLSAGPSLRTLTSAPMRVPGRSTSFPTAPC